MHSEKWKVSVLKLPRFLLHLKQVMSWTGTCTETLSKKSLPPKSLIRKYFAICVQQFLHFWEQTTLLCKNLQLKNKFCVNSASSVLLSENLSYETVGFVTLVIFSWQLSAAVCGKLSRNHCFFSLIRLVSNLVFFAFAHQLCSSLLHGFFHLPSEVLVMLGYGFHIPLFYFFFFFFNKLFFCGMAGARWLFNWNSVIYIYVFLIFEFSIILFPLPHCSTVIDFPVRSITALDFQKSYLLLTLLCTAINFIKDSAPCCFIWL